MSPEEKPKGIFDVLKDAATKAAKQAQAAGLGSEGLSQVQDFLNTRLKPMIKQEIEDQLFCRIKAELRKQFLYQWLAIVVGIGIAIAVAWVR